MTIRKHKYFHDNQKSTNLMHESDDVTPIRLTWDALTATVMSLSTMHKVPSLLPVIFIPAHQSPKLYTENLITTEL